VRCVAALALSDVRPPDVAALLPGLEDAETVVRRDTAASLVKLGDSSTMSPAIVKQVADLAPPALVKRIGDHHWNAAHNGTIANSRDSKDLALKALDQVAPKRVPEALLGATRSKSEHVRAWVCVHLAKQKDEACREALTNALKDPNASVREAATRALK
jgi:HEAT repeat protein